MQKRAAGWLIGAALLVALAIGATRPAPYAGQATADAPTPTTTTQSGDPGNGSGGGGG